MTDRMKRTDRGRSRTSPARPVTFGHCICGGIVIDRGIGKMPLQCDKCSDDKQLKRARDHYELKAAQRRFMRKAVAALARYKGP